MLPFRVDWARCTTPLCAIGAAIAPPMVRRCSGTRWCRSSPRCLGSLCSGSFSARSICGPRFRPRYSQTWWGLCPCTTSIAAGSGRRQGHHIGGGRFCRSGRSRLAESSCRSPPPKWHAISASPTISAIPRQQRSCLRSPSPSSGSCGCSSSLSSAGCSEWRHLKQPTPI